MASVNKVILIGRLGADPELKYTQNGSPVCRLRLATDESFTDKNGNRTERAEWHSVVVFQRAAEACNSYLKKGSQAFIEGKLSTRKWQAQDGTDRFSTEIHAERVQFLDKKENAPQTAAQPQRQRPQPQTREAYSPPSGMDDIPF